MTLNEWIARYEDKAERYVPEEGSTRFFEPEHGFMDYIIKNEAIIVDHTCTNDIHYMHDKAREIGRAHGCTTLYTSTYRSPKAYMRLNVKDSVGGLDLRQSGYRKNGKFYWVFEEVLM